MGILLSFLMFWASAAENYSVDENPLDYSSYGESSYYIGSDVKNPLTIETLRKTIDALPSPSIETLLPALKQIDPSLFKNYVFMYHSRSLQPATPENPRILLATAGAEMVIAFNGSPKQQAYRQLEVMFFDRKTNRFSFQEIDFTGEKPVYSEINPQKCLSCHQSSSRTVTDPRPNWEPYNLWPGALNSVSGSTDVFKEHHEKFNPYLKSQRDQENRIAKQFFNGNYYKTHARYKYLEPFQGIFDDENYNGSPSDYGLPNRMPTHITDNFGALNGRRLARMIREKYPELFEIYKFAILSALYCGEIPLPENVMDWHRMSLKGKNISWPSTLDVGGRYITGIDQAFDFIFKAYGVDTSDWSMDFNTGGKFAAFQKYGLPSNVESTSPVYANAFRDVWGLTEYDSGSCRAMKQKSREVAAEKFPPRAFGTDSLDFQEIQLKTNTPLIQRCIGCHVTTGIAPYIPFDDPIKLKVALNSNNKALLNDIQYRLGPFAGFYEAMPLMGNATPEEKQDLMNYFTRLALDR